ncbi:MAG TPA: hypothetical protein VEK33_18785 [Terriglobales bacterium]|nr:hypothetical protein [Terriglobales bacterium]
MRKSLVIIFCCVLAGAVCLPAAKADTWDQMTKIQFDEPVEIPGYVLPAGSYWFILQSGESDRDLVQIFSEDWSHLYATLQTNPTERPQATDGTEIEFAERPYNTPEAVLKWYYPGLLTGHEFLYSGKQKKEFAGDAQQNVLVETAPL